MNTLHYIINNVFRQKQVYLFFNSWTPLFSFVFYKMNETLQELLLFSSVVVNDKATFLANTLEITTVSQCEQGPSAEKCWEWSHSIKMAAYCRL